MPEPPTGTVTFLFTDIEGSTRRWEEGREAMSGALRRHDEILREAIEAHGGFVFKTVGDAFCAAFADPLEAMAAALLAQRALMAQDWAAFGADFADLRVRIALHIGVADERAGDYFGPPVNRVARLLAVGHGGQVLLSQAVAAALGDRACPDVTLRDLGERRLRDLREPEHILQVVVPDLPSEFPPLVALDARPNNLPVQLTSLVGRDGEIAELRRLLRDANGPRLVTLTGTGGTGKTRLALQVAADLIDDFGHGVWFVDLAPLADPDLVATAIADALSVPEMPGEDILATTTRWLSTRRLLLVLDNYERLLPAASVVATLLQAAPGLKVLVTSREPLHLVGERRMPVAPLPVPAVGESEDEGELLQYHAVELFLQRARDADPAFAATSANAPTIAEICVRLDGLPLAIELAAARVQSLSVQDIAARLDRSLRLLTRGARDLPERHRTIRGTIAWSYDLLEPGEKALFRRLSVFPGGAHLEAAHAVCDDDSGADLDVVDGLASLVEKSLVRHTVTDDGWSRYGMLETVREFGLEGLREAGEEPAARASHARYYVERLDRIWRRDENVSDPSVDARYVAPEEDNLRAALAWCVENDPAAGLVLMGALNGGLFRAPEGRRWLSDLGSRVPEAPPTVRAGALVALGSIANGCGDQIEAERLHREAVRLYRETGDLDGAALAQTFVCFHLTRSGQADACRQELELARELVEASDRVRARVSYHSVAGELSLTSGELDDYLSHREARLRIHVASGGVNPWDERNDLAFAYYLAGRAREAREILDPAIEEARGRGEVDAVAWDTAGRIYLALGLVTEAETFHREGLADLDPEYDHGCLVWHMEGMASVALRRGRHRSAAVLFGAGSVVRESTGSALEPAEMPRRQKELASLRAALGEAGLAAALAEGRTLTRGAAVNLALEGVGAGG